MIGIGPRLKRERIRLKLSQSALGTIGGVETNAQGNYESGLRFPRADYLSRIAEAGVDITYVITGQEKTALDRARCVDSELSRVIARLHSSLHDITQHLYQMTHLLEAHYTTTEPPHCPTLDTVRHEAEAISLAVVRLIYITSTVGPSR
ncbi:helix-turn-helix transcriptional regulator [Pseudomonas syringae]|nr:helix-turn-helix transcriptional regulator [Pseudomonas syringae]MBD8790201.1 helix-turn-helix transcriptional regulator [Pseudomonas syringae]MBD8803797.1 helix-turn-helix transcriptional regulator [Pseudomonas syringae]MBD8810127.1 helix-turn-helix transcriptional regulator [Pseudomonas syringae]